MSDAKTILVLDDSELVLEVVRSELESAGFRVASASNLSELGGAIRGCDKIDLVLLDVQMPEILGDELGVVLRETYHLRSPIYLLSSLEARILTERVAEAGLDGYICKSDGMDALVLRVREILGIGA